MQEILAVPEEYLEEVIKIIRNGLANTKDVPDEVHENLTRWCNDEEQYLKSLGE